MTQITEILTQEVKDIFEDSDLNIRKVLREFATCFGTDVTVHEVATALEDYTIPKKEINGVVYKAGYKGSAIIAEGNHTANLLDVKSTKDKIKLMFGVDGKYIWQSIPKDDLNIDSVLEFAQSVEKEYSIDVKHEVIENTGGIHAVVCDSMQVG